MVNPTPYSNTDHAESRAINIFEGLVSDEHVKSHLDKRDKVPNHDGYVELVDDENVPIGRMDIQIKKLPNDFDPSNPKIKIPLSLYAYSKRTSNPTFYLGVDVTRKEAYWIHIHNDLKNSSDVELTKIDDDQVATTIQLELDNFNDGLIDGQDKNFLSRWREITEDYLKRVHKFEKLREKYEKLEEHADPSLRTQDDDFVYIHLFLDEVNNLLDSFDVVKHRFYSPQTWKLGFMCTEFLDSITTYALYPINYDINDIQIKKVDDFSGLEKLGFDVAYGNPVKYDPKGHASKFIQERVDRIIRNRHLFIRNKFLANEFSYAFVNNFHLQLGLEKKNSYTIKEIYETLSNNEFNINSIYTPFTVFDECITFLRNSRIKQIEKTYFEMDYSPNRDLSVWNRNVMDNLHIFFDNLYDVYNDVLANNFPSIKNELNYLFDVSKLIVVVRLKEEYLEDRIGLYYLIGESSELSIDIYPEDDQRIPTIIRNDFIERKKVPRNSFTDGFQINGQHFKFKSITHRFLDFIYEDAPMFFYINDEIKRNTDQYFKNNLLNSPL